MKIGMILGLTGGALALIFGVIMALIGGTVGGVASAFGQSGAVAKTGILVFLSIGLPVMAIVGSAMLRSNLQVALSCMVVPAALLGGLAFAAGSWLPAILGAMIGAGAAFAWAEARVPAATGSE